VSNLTRSAIGVWSELPPGARWANEGISRIVGFLIEGGAETGEFVFHVLVPRGMAETVRSDLRTLHAQEGVDWVVDEPAADFEAAWIKANGAPATKAQSAALLAAYANAHVQVLGWINTFPHFTGSRLLKQRKAVLLPDAIPYDFPIGWDYNHYWGSEGEWVRWKTIARETLSDGDAVIAHSKHVAKRHGVKLLGLDESLIRVVPHAPPDLAPALPFVVDRQKTPETRRLAANILRDYAATNGLEYLRNYPFEEVPFAMVATQDRVTKNIGRAAEAVRRMVRDKRSNLKLFTTAPLHFGETWTLLPGLVESQQMMRDIVSLPDVPRDVHAALFHCATLTVHPTFYEGIVGSLTFYEAVSVGTPCLMGLGPHIHELLETEPELAPLVFDPYDIDVLVRLIAETMENPKAAFDMQRPAYERRRKRGWDQVARAYANAAAGLDEASER
jgi:glycosyltransferase involved in cell wall biosynthesis